MVPGRAAKNRCTSSFFSASPVADTQVQVRQLTGMLLQVRQHRLEVRRHHLHTLTRPAMIVSTNRSTSRITSCSTSSVRPPTSSADTSCHSEMSKHWGAIWATTAPSPTRRSWILAWRWLSIPACSHIAPLGSPVEPEVK